MPSRFSPDPLRLELGNPWLRTILIGGPLLGLACAVLGLLLVPTVSQAYVAGAVVLPGLAIVLFVWGLRRPYLMPLAAIVLMVEALVAAATLPMGIVLAMALPVIGIALAQGVLRARPLLWATVAAGAVAVIGVAIAVLVGPAHGLFVGTSPVVTIGALAVLVVFALALDWRATDRMRVALDVAQSELAARRATEGELARTSEMLSAIVEHSPLATQAFGMDRTVTVWNKASERIFGWTAEEVLGKPMPAAMTPDDERETSAQRVARTMAGEATRGDRVRRLTKDGREVWIEIYGAVLRDPDGRPIGVAGQLADVTERVALETQLAHAERLEAIGRLAGGIAHDFNNTLTAIGGFASLIEGEAEDRVAVREDAATIVDIVERSSQLTRQLLAFARRTTLLPTVVDIRTAVRTVEPTLHRLLDGRIDLTVRGSDEALVTRVDAGQLEQALVNLALNARDAMDDGGRVVVSMRRVRVAPGDVADDPDLAGAFVAVAVCDTGTGMDATVAGQAFEPFFTTKEPGRGTGLGLAMVRDFARQSGGTVRLASTPGTGTTVELLFPEVAGALIEDDRATVELTRERGTESVLLVDDDPAVAAFARRTLADLGYDVRVANGRTAALRLLEDDPRAVDLLVTDLFLPEGTGTDLADAVRRVRPGITTLFVCGYTADALADRGVRAEGLEMLAKPYNGVELAARVRRILDAGARPPEVSPAD